ncbi:hypothetical protein QBC44DRAFT_308625 [Cladorrhinum sp. PSN332]|nr:hypothetical protein QBC44DRAFT_308625 [Cladorrhinum sp. PSN332]
MHMHANIFLAALLGVIRLNPAQAQGADTVFSSPCRAIELQGLDIAAVCREDREPFQLFSTRLALERCIVNNNGDLTGGVGGGFSNTCQNCRLSSGSALFLKCDCEDGQGGRKTTAMVLAHILLDGTGALRCFDVLGSAVPFDGEIDDLPKQIGFP